MFLCTFKYFYSDTLYMNFQLSSKSSSFNNSSKLQVFEASPRCRKKERKDAVTRPSATIVLLIFMFLYSI
jgi:hypothetical protein